ncbi:MAG: host attachment protein [Spirochaetia bacterium]|nr:host attachment protein [Spirochaetia bacterium]
MEKTIVVVANRSSARFFKYEGPNKSFQLLESVNHPEGRMKNHEFLSGEPGESFDSHGHGRHNLAREVEPKEEEAKRFATEIAENLDKRRQKENLNRIILAAEGGFMGILKDSISKETAKLISNYVSKDLAKIESRNIHSHFENVLLI